VLYTIAAGGVPVRVAVVVITNVVIIVLVVSPVSHPRRGIRENPGYRSAGQRESQ
jgi:hypothetical protein